MKPTNWIVFTGAPSSGKSTILEILKSKGQHVEPETARLYIETELSKGRTLKETRKDEGAFQRGLIKAKLDLESTLDPKARVFLDRAMPDSLAYYQIAGIDPEELIPDCSKFRYAKVFLFERLPLEMDNVRTENEDSAKKLEHLLDDAYRSLGYDVLRVPLFSKEKFCSVKSRLDFILENI